MNIHQYETLAKRAHDIDVRYARGHIDRDRYMIEQHALFTELSVAGAELAYDQDELKSTPVYNFKHVIGCVQGGEPAPAGHVCRPEGAVGVIGCVNCTNTTTCAAHTRLRELRQS